MDKVKFVFFTRFRGSRLPCSDSELFNLLVILEEFLYEYELSDGSSISGYEKEVALARKMRDFIVDSSDSSLIL